MCSDTGKSMMEAIEANEAEPVLIAGKELFPRSFLMGINIMGENLSEPALSRTWYWSPIEGLKPEGAIRKTNDFIRQEIARMNIHLETGINSTLRRKKGIVIGVARAVSTEMYRIVPGNLTVEEIDTTKLVVGDDGKTIVIKFDVDSVKLLLLLAQIHTRKSINPNLENYDRKKDSN
ncbi:unnamed protein product [Arabidopsis thaliana]|uniref:Uncharacterized protein n=1 Tax=Arabidopsis thaliana TaxID=3702 RepID=A0A5S9XHB6_ARATH|nr:unnamed protein product [Arabidopsis thaliana]